MLLFPAMFGEKSRRIEDLEAENNRLSQELAGIQDLLPYAVALRDEITKATGPYTNPAGYDDDVIGAAHGYLRDIWTEDARMRATQAIAKRDGEDLMRQLIKEIYAEEGDEMYREARTEILNNPEELEIVRARAARRAIRFAERLAIRDIGREFEANASEESERITSIRRTLKLAAPAGRIILDDIAPLLKSADSLEVGVSDPDHQGVFATILFTRHQAETQGWLYGGHDLGKNKRYGSGVTEKNIPSDIFVVPGCLTTDASSNEPKFVPELIYGEQLAVHVPGKYDTYPIRTREPRSSFSDDGYDYDNSKIKVVRFVPRPVLSWVKVARVE